MQGAIPVCLICLLLLSGTVAAQKQLILLKGEKVVLRLYPGDEFTFTKKGNRTIIRSYVNNISDTSVVAHKDVVPFNEIDRIYFERSNFGNVVGGLLVTAGAGYFLIDQFNIVVVQGEDPDLEKRVVIPSALMLGAGLPLMLFKKKYQKTGGRYRLRMVDKESVFYKPDLRKDASGFPDE